MVGIGPGNRLDRTHRAEEAIAQSSIIIGYSRYLSAIADLTGAKKCISSAMGDEIERCTTALTLAGQGNTVSLISSGDPGVYGMAGLVIELQQKKNIQVPIHIIAGVTAASASAAAVGAPLMLDYAVLSLSDLLIRWEVIEKRLRAIAQAGLVIVLYNPKSHSRTRPFEQAVGILRQHRPDSTIVAVVTHASSDEQKVEIMTLADLENAPVTMSSTVIVGNETTIHLDRWMITKRGYEIA